MESAIVLTKNYQFWGEANIKKVMKWVLLDKIEIVVSHDTKEIGTLEFKIKVPLIVRLLNFAGYKTKTERVPYSAGAVYSRDNNICQYWHYDEKTKRKFKYKCSMHDRTIDHVMPLSKGGKKGFENEVCCCRYHNEIVKKNRLHTDVGLELIRKPFEPKREIGSFVIMRFAFNKNKLSHKMYQEKIIGQEFSHVIA